MSTEKPTQQPPAKSFTSLGRRMETIQRPKGKIWNLMDNIWIFMVLQWDFIQIDR